MDSTRDMAPAGFELPAVKLPAEIVTGSGMTSRLLFLTLGKLGNISVTFDSQFRDAPAAVSLLSGMTLKQALDAVTAIHQHLLPGELAGDDHRRARHARQAA